MFRMPWNSFDHLCAQLEQAVGSRTFKAKSILFSHGVYDALPNVGGICPGELKVAMMLQLLAGACYLDMIGMFSICNKTVFEVLHKTLG